MKYYLLWCKSPEVRDNWRFWPRVFGVYTLSAILAGDALSGVADRCDCGSTSGFGAGCDYWSNLLAVSVFILFIMHWTQAVWYAHEPLTHIAFWPRLLSIGILTCCGIDPCTLRQLRVLESLTVRVFWGTYILDIRLYRGMSYWYGWHIVRWDYHISVVVWAD